MKERYKKGDRVAIYSLQSFHGPGFYKGHPGTVKQDQYSGSVIVVPDPYTTPGGTKSQESYEVYPQQLRRLRKKVRKEITRKMLEEAYFSHHDMGIPYSSNHLKYFIQDIEKRLGREIRSE
jgi:hypothetical protein